ncbi:hypothetical protein B0F90DRAFT_1919505 [Multifurca ochricompacta]|uniref:Uncharacterized protein n=1 Tax=Multifurca ochricompacta TaxID=376703 RepID=A0AAD4LZ26_9AGAM|nr:hypothetical protein B0F90DRAFT_1919505 [Multifurca ochricompacta]
MASPTPVGTRPQRTREPAYSRDSNALRASVLDAALQLGIGTSRAVENLLFNSVLEEEDESITTPSLTSASAATSDESSPSVPPWTGIPPQFIFSAPKSASVVPTSAFEVHVSRAPSEDSHAPSLSHAHLPRKLRKARKDGYESDGGYLSDSSKKKKGKDQKKNGTLSLSQGVNYQSDGGYLSEGAKKGLDKKKKQKDKKGDKKSHIASEDGDISDGGYLSESSAKRKKSFFRLGSRSLSTSRRTSVVNVAPPPPVPALPTPPLPIAERFARSPMVSFDLPNGNLPNGSAPFQTAHPSVPPPVDGSMAFMSSLSEKNLSPPPPWADTIRPPSVDASVENSTSSTTSHEWADFPRTQSHESDGRAQSSIPSERVPASPPAAPRPQGVRFTPSTRFSPSDATFPISPSQPTVSVPSQKQSPRRNTSPPIASTLNSSPTSALVPPPVPPISRTASPLSGPSSARANPSRNPGSRVIPSPLLLTPSASHFTRGTSPAASEFSIISSSEFIVPSPRPRFWDDLPPPSPPPVGPLPDVPSQGLYSQPIPSIRRGRESPFPVRGILPVQDAERIIERTERTRKEALLARQTGARVEESAATMGDDVDDLDVDEVDDDGLPWLTERVAAMSPSPSSDQLDEDEQEWPDDESVRPDIAQFYFSAPDGPHASRTYTSDTDGGLMVHRLLDVPDDERSTFTYSYAAPSSSADARVSTMRSVHGRTDTESYSEEVDGSGVADDCQSHVSFVDDERSHEMRARLIARVDALYGAANIPPVPRLRPF